MNKITDSVIYIGANDRELDLFEGQYIVPNGMAYNSYAVIGEKTAIIDTIDKSKTEEWLANLEEALEKKNPDYLIVQHMEPDHSASIKAFAEKYPETVIVGNKKTFTMIGQFFPGLELKNILVVENGEELDLGNRKLTFTFAPMVHWPEVMMTYDDSEKIIFSADAFGKFGALDAEEDWACEARRYYIGIVGKYGAQVQAVIKNLTNLDVEIICPLHGPVLDENLEYYFNLYDLWSGYKPETEGVCICYTSVYGNTKKAALMLRDELVKLGVETVAVNDLARCDLAEAVEDAFRYDRLVLATTTYNGDIFPFMKHFIDALTERNYRNRFIAFMENGTWAPIAVRIMKEAFVKSKNLMIAENNVTIKSALNDESEAKVKALAEELVESHMDIAAENEKATEDKAKAEKRGFVCNICGYIYEGDTLPADFKCPLCKRGAEDFSPIK